MVSDIVRGRASQPCNVEIQAEKPVTALRWSILHDACLRIQEIDHHGVAGRARRSAIEKNQWMRCWPDDGPPIRHIGPNSIGHNRLRLLPGAKIANRHLNRIQTFAFDRRPLESIVRPEVLKCAMPFVVAPYNKPVPQVIVFRIGQACGPGDQRADRRGGWDRRFKAHWGDFGSH